jgi:NCAIR mutase (PurE)-related protein
MAENNTDLGFARPDYDRIERRGFGEVIYGPGKTKGVYHFFCKSILTDLSR